MLITLEVFYQLTEFYRVRNFIFSELDDLVIHFINASTFYDDENDVYPAELAMAKFSLKGGITDDIQIRIKPKSLPLGSLLKATEKAEQHKYDLPPNCDGEEDYINILEAMIKFLHPMQKLPIFFTESDNMTTLDQTRRVVEKIFYESQEDDLISELKFYPVSEIFVVLQELTVNNRNRQSEKPLAKFPSIVFAADIMKNKTFLYSTQGCDYHKGT